jgi:hypothetical protein
VTIRVRPFRRTALLGVAAALIAIAASAHPADAQNRQKCKQGPARIIKIPRQPDIRVSEQTCLIAFPQGGNAFKFKAWVHTKWDAVAGGNIKKRFDGYDIQARLEFNPASPDTDLEVANCNILPMINAAPGGEATCETPVSEAFTEVDPAFTGDGAVTYDVNGDGKRSVTRQLHGTGRV